MPVIYLEDDPEGGSAVASFEYVYCDACINRLPLSYSFIKENIVSLSLPLLHQVERPEQ